jgi:ketosteroid isomerase-like protein
MYSRRSDLRILTATLALVAAIAGTLAAAPQDHGNPTAMEPAKASPDNVTAAAEIKQMVAKYAEAVNREPVDLELASSVWDNSPDVTLIYPMAEVRGWDHIRQDFYQGIMEAWFSQRTLTPRDIEVHDYGDCAWAEFSWRFIAKSKKDGAKVETNGRETQIYHKAGPHRWVLVHVHYSSLSAAESPRASGTS